MPPEFARATLPMRAALPGCCGACGIVPYCSVGAIAMALASFWGAMPFAMGCIPGCGCMIAPVCGGGAYPCGAALEGYMACACC